MSGYVDVYILPIAEENIPAYKKLAAGAARVFIRHGALTYREFVASDLSAELGTFPFAKMAKAKPGETVVCALVEFNSEAHRNRTMKKIFADPELEAMMSGPAPFNYKRMAYGGFKLLVGA